mmetsp:Transcript_18315/g.30547  ORF Transcript_18315/g.30547 Transcript_18315/m.30547 type:complete len:89 (+) Transcript_18315:1151-1417(+)
MCGNIVPLKWCEVGSSIYFVSIVVFVGVVFFWGIFFVFFEWLCCRQNEPNLARQQVRCTSPRTFIFRKLFGYEFESCQSVSDIDIEQA